MQTVPVSNPPLKTAAPELPEQSLTLDDLAARSFDSLADLYRRSRCASTLRAVDGAPKGRMLAVRTVSDLPISGLLRRFAASRAFVWDGKTFTSVSDRDGSGINRVQIPGALGRQKLFPFKTLFGSSLFDGQQTLVLDYDLDENPSWIRKIHDEIREVSKGLYLGPAMWKTSPTAATTVLWFALDTRSHGWQ